jgi:hypothetical protein
LSGCQAGSHDYSVVIDRTSPAAEQVRWYPGGQLFHTVSESQIGTSVWTAAVDNSVTIIFDLAIGGGYPNGVCGCVTPSNQTSSGGTMSIGYVGVLPRLAARWATALATRNARCLAR